MDVLNEIKLLMADPEIATTITLNWITWTGTPTVDPATGSKIGTRVTHTDTIRGLFHEINASSVERRFAEIKAGDAMIDILPDDYDTISGYEELELVVAGKTWVQKKVGDELLAIWDANVGDYPTLRTFALTRKT